MVQTYEIDNRAFINEISDLECRLVRLISDEPNWLSKIDESALRWALSLARVSTVEIMDRKHRPSVVEIGHATDVYRQELFNLLSPHVAGKDKVDKEKIAAQVSLIRKLTFAERKELLDLYRHSLSPADLDAAVQSRPLALALSGGGGTSFVFIGAFCELEDAGIVPGAITGTSMGAMLGAYRAREKKFNLSDLEKTLLPLSWEKVTKALRGSSRFGLPATFRLYLRDVFEDKFHLDGQFMRLSDLAIPFRATVSGVAHIEGQPDPNFETYEHLLENFAPKASDFRIKQKGIMRVLLDLASKPLQAIYLGKDELTSQFDVIDAAGFSAAVPGLFHYDIDDSDERMIALTAKIMEKYGVLRLFDGGLVDNLPAKEAKHAIQTGVAKGRDPFVLALDGFAPNLHDHWLFLPLMRVAAERSKEGYKSAHLTITYKQVLSPLNLFPSKEELKRTIVSGKAETVPHMAFIKKMLGPIPLPAGIVTETDGQTTG